MALDWNIYFFFQFELVLLLHLFKIKELSHGTIIWKDSNLFACFFIFQESSINFCHSAYHSKLPCLVWWIHHIQLGFSYHDKLVIISILNMKFQLNECGKTAFFATNRNIWLHFIHEHPLHYLKLFCFWYYEVSMAEFFKMKFRFFQGF